MTEIRDTLREILAELRKSDEEVTLRMLQEFSERTRNERVADMVQASLLARSVPKTPETKQ